MKRWLTKLALFLLLGAIVNVAVAWGCALWSPFTPPSSDLQQLRVSEWLQQRQFSPQPGDPYEGQAVDGIGLTWLVILFDPKRHESTLDINQREGVWAVATLAGLPIRSLQAEIRVRLALPPIDNSVRVIDGIRLDERFREQDQFLPYLLPLHPIWPGFAINTAFYAAILWLLALGPFAARRFTRRRRGRCIKCGYDLSHAEHEVCPECGVEREPMSGAGGAVCGI